MRVNPPNTTEGEEQIQLNDSDDSDESSETEEKEERTRQVRRPPIKVPYACTCI